MSKELEVQTRNALDFVQKLYLEISYLIKEVEGLLVDEEFVIGKPSGYGVTTRSSVGLEAINVQNWLTKTFTVFFCPKDRISTTGGQTTTEFSPDLKVLLLDIDLGGKEKEAPKIMAGCLRNISPKRPSFKKFESAMVRFAYNRKMLADYPVINYEDSYVSYEGKFIKYPLLSVNDSSTLEKKIVQPMLELYREGDK